MSGKHSFVYVCLIYPDLVIARAEIQFRVYLCPMKFTEEFFNDRNGKLVWDGSFTIHTKSPTTIFPFDK